MGFYEAVFDALNGEGAPYIVVGGVAVVLHGYVRFTKDLDLIIDLTPTAVAATLRALKTLGLAPSQPVAPGLLADPVTREHWVRERGLVVLSFVDPDDPFRSVDVVTHHPLPFEEMWRRSRLMALGRSTVRVAAIADLIALKRQVGRPIDAQDVLALEALAELDRSDDEEPL